MGTGKERRRAWTVVLDSAISIAISGSGFTEREWEAGRIEKQKQRQHNILLYYEEFVLCFFFAMYVGLLSVAFPSRC